MGVALAFVSAQEEIGTGACSRKEGGSHGNGYITVTARLLGGSGRPAVAPAPETMSTNVPNKGAVWAGAVNPMGFAFVNPVIEIAMVPPR